MNTWRQTLVYQSEKDLVPEVLRNKAALMGIKVEIIGQKVYFICPAAGGGTHSFAAGEAPSEQQLDRVFTQACHHTDLARGLVPRN